MPRTQTEKIIAVVITIVLIFGLAIAFAFWRFREDARGYLKNINTDPILFVKDLPPTS